jgi:hypothetical protein
MTADELARVVMQSADRIEEHLAPDGDWDPVLMTIDDEGARVVRLEATDEPSIPDQLGIARSVFGAQLAAAVIVHCWQVAVRMDPPETIADALARYAAAGAPRPRDDPQRGEMLVVVAADAEGGRFHAARIVARRADRRPVLEDEWEQRVTVAAGGAGLADALVALVTAAGT